MAENSRPSKDPNPPLRGFQRREVEHAAIQQGLTPEEYGLYRGHYPGSKTPVQSAIAIGFLSGFLTLIGPVISVGTVRAVTHESHDAFKFILMGLAIWVSVFFSWRSFKIQRRAEKLRKAHGLALIEPSAEALQRPTPEFYRFIDPHLPGESPKD